MKKMKSISFIYNSSVELKVMTYQLTEEMKMGIRDRLRTRGVSVAAVDEDEDTGTTEVVAPTKAPVKPAPKAKAPVAPVVEDDDDDEPEVAAPPKRGPKAKAPVATVEEDEPSDEDDLEDEPAPAPVKRGPKAKAPVAVVEDDEPLDDDEPEPEDVAPPKRGPKAKAPVATVEDDDEPSGEDDLEDEPVAAAPPKRSPKAKAPAEKIVKPSSKPAFIQTKAVVEKVYEADTWLPRDEYLNRLMPAFADTAFAGITKTQLKEFLEVFEAATVDILQTNDIYIFGIKSRTVVTPPRIYAPRDSGLPHVRTAYHTEINAHRDVTIKLSFDKETRRGTVNATGAFVEGKFEGKKFIPGVWQDKETFIPKKK